MALTYICQEKILQSFCQKEVVFSPNSTFFISLHWEIPDRFITSVKDFLALSEPVTWQPSEGVEYIGVNNATDVVFRATLSGEVQAAVVWAQNYEETYPLDIIPLVPFTVVKQQTIIYASGTFQISVPKALQSDSFSERVFAIAYLNSPEVISDDIRIDLSGIDSPILEWEIQEGVAVNTEAVVLDNPLQSSISTANYYQGENLIVQEVYPEAIAYTTITYPPGEIKLYWENTPILPLMSDFEWSVFDIPLLKSEDVDRGVYFGIKSSVPWSYAKIYISRDGGLSYSFVQDFVADSLYSGRIISYQDSATTHLLPDFNTEILVDFVEDLVLSSSILLLWGKEIITSDSIEAIEPGKYKISQLFRGLRGTEGEIGNHSIADRIFILQNGADEILGRIPLLLEDIDRELVFKAEIFQQDDSSSNLHYSLIYQNISERAYAPAIPEIILNHQTLDISLISHSRAIHERWGNGMELDIYQNGTKIRTLISEDGNFIYYRSDQLSDGGVDDPLELVLASTNLRGRGSELNFGSNIAKNLV